jgi:hypothetical protein
MGLLKQLLTALAIAISDGNRDVLHVTQSDVSVSVKKTISCQTVGRLSTDGR